MVVSGILSYQTHSYSVSTPVFEGPLDLLLQLIERSELDITKLSLALVTDQYLDYLHNIEIQSAEEVSAFLVIAARLVQIKSEAILPRPPVRMIGEDDPGESLVEQLRAYKRYKQIAQLFGRKEEAGYRTFLRLAPPPQIAASFDLGDIDVVQFSNAAQRILGIPPEKPALASIVASPKITIREKIGLINKSFQKKQQVPFYSLINDLRSRIEIVVTFFAVLELVKRNLLHVSQEGLFGKIVLESTTVWDDTMELELEFGE